MRTRYISGVSISSETAKWADAQAWLAANDVDPGKLPMDSHLTVNYDAKTLTFIEVDEDENGMSTLNFYWNENYKTERTIPLKSLPEDHNI